MCNGVLQEDEWNEGITTKSEIERCCHPDYQAEIYPKPNLLVLDPWQVSDHLY